MKTIQDFLQAMSNSAADTVAGPVDLLSMGLNKLGVPVGDKPIGGSNWQKEMGLRREVKQGIPRVLGETAGLLGPALVTKFAPQIARAVNQGVANVAEPAALNKQAGMIKTPFGRIPETSKEIDGFYNQLRSKADALGYDTKGGSSNVSGSRYLTFMGKETKDGDIPSFQVRMSNHGDRYPNSVDADARFSVDPDSLNTFEMAKDWLKSNGFNLDKKITKPTSISPNLLAGTKVSELNALRLSRGGTPVTTAEEVARLGLIDDVGLLGSVGRSR